MIEINKVVGFKKLKTQWSLAVQLKERCRLPSAKIQGYT